MKSRAIEKEKPLEGIVSEFGPFAAAYRQSGMVGRSAYSVVNEQGKIRSDRTGAAKSRTCGDSPFLNREYSIRARLAEAGIGDFLDEFTDGCFSDFNWAPSQNRAENFTNAEPIMHYRVGYWDDSSGSRISHGKILISAPMLTILELPLA